jgi:hypothetical protein
MRHGEAIETRRDRRALARDAGMGRLSATSVLAGALCGLAAFEALALIAGAIAVAINGSTNFAAMSSFDVKATTGLVTAVATFCAFLFAGYVGGRLARRRGATHGLLSGILGAVLAATSVFLVIRSGTDNALARVARHIGVAATWHQWRGVGLTMAAVIAITMVLAGLVGGVKGERWHGKLLARAVDPTVGPEAEQRAAARKSLDDSEAARLAAAARAGRLTSKHSKHPRHPKHPVSVPPAGAEPELVDTPR